MFSVQQNAPVNVYHQFQYYLMRVAFAGGHRAPMTGAGVPDRERLPDFSPPTLRFSRRTLLEARVCVSRIKSYRLGRMTNASRILLRYLPQIRLASISKGNFIEPFTVSAPIPRHRRAMQLLRNCF